MASWAAGQQVFYIDARFGDDTFSGTESMPLKTITQGLMAHVPPQDLVLILKPGVYTQATGEVFPIVPPTTCSIRAQHPLSAAIDVVGLGTGAVIEVADGSSFTLEGVLVTSSGFGVSAISTNSTIGLDFDRCEFNNSINVLALVNDGGAVNADLDRCLLRGVESGIRAVANSGDISLSTTNSQFMGLARGCEFLAGNEGTVFHTSDRTVYADNSAFGVRSDVTVAGGQIFNSFQHCVFSDNGAQFVGAAIGDTTDAAFISAGQPTGTQTLVQNSIFWQNTQDLLVLDPSSDLVFFSMVDDPAVAASGPGNILNQDPLFVNPAGHDFHVRAGSPAIDTGLTATSLFDFAGDPVLGTPDMGVDEFHPSYLGTPPLDNPATIGANVELRFVGPSGSRAFLALAAVPAPIMGFGNQLWVPVGALPPLDFGPMPTGAPITEKTVSLPIPTTAVPGMITACQSIYLSTSGQVTFGLNVLNLEYR